MRADIHDGAEQMLQSETEYIDARPRQPASTKASCTARPDHTWGQKRSFGGRADHSRCTPITGHLRCRPLLLKSVQAHIGTRVQLEIGAFLSYIN
jgi:hypothetical protein